jgi:DNA end-binding protein Ku
MPRAIWKGAIAFGLVHIPVAMYPASQENEVDFDWLDKRSLDPVGYKRVNKRTGKPLDKEQIVKGVKQDGGDYVVLSDDEIRAAFPTKTQTIDIESFVPAADVSFVYLEKPYYLEPTGRADKVYALLREAMTKASLIGIARIVLRNKEHLAALLPAGPALMVGTLRWANEIRPANQLSLPAAGTAQLKADELRMAEQLIGQMAASWKPEQFADTFSQGIRKLVARKAEAGEAHAVQPLEEAPPPAGGQVIDLTELLRNSLQARKRTSKGTPTGTNKNASKKATVARKHA